MWQQVKTIASGNCPKEVSPGKAVPAPAGRRQEALLEEPSFL